MPSLLCVIARQLRLRFDAPQLLPCKGQGAGSHALSFKGYP